jgi:hypothetical protein
LVFLRGIAAKLLDRPHVDLGLEPDEERIAMQDPVSKIESFVERVAGLFVVVIRNGTDGELIGIRRSTSIPTL